MGWLRGGAFVTRCAGSATVSYMIAFTLGLGHPVWAVVSALIVSQDSPSETHRSYRWRIAATVIGLSVAILVNDLGRVLGLDLSFRIAVAVMACAMVARRWPLLRVCMWTAPIVLLTVDPGHRLLRTAAVRGFEVLLGGAVGAGMHLILDLAIEAAVATLRSSATKRLRSS